MNDTPEPSEPERKRKRLLSRLSARDWVELAIYVVFGLIALIAGLGWLLARF